MDTSMQWYPVAKPETGVVGRFEWDEHSKLDIIKSKEMDEKVYKRIIICRMKATGSNDESIVEMKDHNRRELMRRFPDAWQSFEGVKMDIKGTPLTELGPDMNEARILGFRLAGVFVLEQMAELTDAACENIGFGTKKLRERAIAYLAGPPAPKGPYVEVPNAAQAKQERTTPRRRGRPPKERPEPVVVGLPSEAA